MAAAKRVASPFLVLLSWAAALGNAVVASVFCLCSHESIQRLIQQDGLLAVFGKRWLGFFVLGAVVSAVMALLQLLAASFSPENQANSRWVFVLGLKLQLVAAFVGSLLFTYFTT